MLNNCDKKCSEEQMEAIKTLESKIDQFETKLNQFETKIDQLGAKIDQLKLKIDHPGSKTDQPEETISAISNDKHNDKQPKDTKPDNQKKVIYSFV